MLLLSVGGVVAGLVAAVIGFVVVLGVCVVVLALIQAILPTAEDAGPAAMAPQPNPPSGDAPAD